MDEGKEPVADATLEEIRSTMPLLRTDALRQNFIEAAIVYGWSAIELGNRILARSQ